jgi:hypothetical protein
MTAFNADFYLAAKGLFYLEFTEDEIKKYQNQKKIIKLLGFCFLAS